MKNMNNLDVIISQARALIAHAPANSVVIVNSRISMMHDAWDMSAVDSDELTAALLALSVAADTWGESREYFEARRLYGDVVTAAKVVKEICRDLNGASK